MKMTCWTETPSEKVYGVALYNFSSDHREALDLNIGDVVYIVEESDDWYRGYTSKNKSQRGIFPKDYIHLKDACYKRNGVSRGFVLKEAPIIQEIASVVREWGEIWKQLFVIGNDKYLENVKKMIQQLIDWRRKLISSKLTNDELKELQQRITARIDSGNALLDLDLVVRDDQGNILNPETSSTVSLYQQHVSAAQRIQLDREKDTRRYSQESIIPIHQRNVEPETESKPAWKNTFNLFVTFLNFVCRIGENSDILINLFDAKRREFISENYLVKWGCGGMPRNIDMLNNCRVVFTDLGIKDRQREKVYLVLQVVRIGVMDPKDLEQRKQTQGLRRPFGVAALDISDLIQGKKDTNEDSQIFIPFLPCGERELMDSVIKRVITAREINHRGQGLWVSYKILQGDLNQIKSDYAHLVLPTTAIARKMGFPEVIMPGDVRNDIYVTILSGEFNKGTKTSDKNVEVTMQVCNDQGEVITGAISQGAGGEMISEYRSLIYYHEMRPRWMEVVKVAISTEKEFKDLHLKFLFKHRSSNEAKDKAEKPFAMSFVKLMNANGTTLEDVTHDMLVYKVDNKKTEFARNYVLIPSTRTEFDQLGHQPNAKVQDYNGALTLNHKDSFQVSTFVCSTKLTHNLDLLGVLKWKVIISNRKVLEMHLEALMKVDGEEIVKFLHDLLDSLFNLMLNVDSDLYDGLVFDALIYVIGLVSDRKYHQFRPVLDGYINDTFSYAMAYNKLMVIFKDVVDKGQVKQDSLLKTMKSLEYIFKLIIQSRLLFSMMNEGRGREQFEIMLRKVLESINEMMKFSTNNSVLLGQGAALKYICSTIPDIIKVLNPIVLSELLVQFIQNIPGERLLKQKVKCINDVIHSPLFQRADCRSILLPMILRIINGLLEKRNELEAAARVLGDIMEVLHQPQTAPHDKDMDLLMEKILRAVIRTVIFLDREGPIAGTFVTLFLGIMRQMAETHYMFYICLFDTSTDLLDFLMEILMVFRDLINKNAFPFDWMEMIMLQNSVILRALRFISHTINDRFSNPFEIQVWNNYFHCSITFLTQTSLQLEQFSINKRNKIIARYHDMRRAAGFEIRSMWFNLGQNKIQLIPEMVGPILEMTLIPETELRRATIPIFFDMMQCEFTQPVPNSRIIQGNFHQVENEIITKLDALVEGGQGDHQYMELTRDILLNLCQNHSKMRESGTRFVTTITCLMQRLLEYRLIIQDEVKEHRMSCIVNLLGFYRDIGRQEMYIRYLHKLCDLHLDCDNYTEAAYSLLLYAQLLQWSDEHVQPMLVSTKYPHTQVHHHLKGKLYLDIIDYFDKGKMWEKAIELCKELAQQYEYELFDYHQLRILLERQAKFYDDIMKTMRPDPEYFRVGYYGRGFPSFLQNKVFIYRGKEYERLSDFNARLQILFPNAELMKSLSTPSDEIKESDKQYLQINAVNTVMEMKKEFRGKAVSEQILKYYNVNEVDTFSYDRRRDEASAEITEMWLDRTHLTITTPLPGILRWFEVKETRTFSLSPLENATETLETKNKKIMCLLSEHRADKELRIDPLSMLLNGIVDPAVNGGLQKYKLFYSDQFLRKSSTERDIELIFKLKELTIQQMRFIDSALKLHKKKSPSSLKLFHDHMEQCFVDMCNQVENGFGLKLGIKQHSSIKRNSTMPASPRQNAISQKDIPAYAVPVTKTSTAAPVARSQSVWVKPAGDRYSSSPPGATSRGSLSTIKQMGNMIKRVSVDSSDGNRHSGEQPIELNEQAHVYATSQFYYKSKATSPSTLTPKRPLRSEVEKRHSRTYSNQVLTLQTSTSDISDQQSIDTSDTEDSDGPPPLPEKSASFDYTNALDEPPPTPLRIGSLSLMSLRNRPVPPLPEEDNDDVTPM